MVAMMVLPLSLEMTTSYKISPQKATQDMQTDGVFKKIIRIQHHGIS